MPRQMQRWKPVLIIKAGLLVSGLLATAHLPGLAQAPTTDKSKTTTGQKAGAGARTEANAPTGWSLFKDPTGEMSVLLPAPVKASKTDTGGAVYDGDEGDITYRVSFRKRSTLPAAREVEVFCGTFATKFAELMESSGHPIKMSEARTVSGENWCGRIYPYVNQSGRPGSVLIAVEDKHNLILHSLGGAADDPHTKLFFSSLVVHQGD
ncbi:MAG: hypothetical protein JSS86_13380 [Cyanobacteria bacterium SZAS LIN-2]|nr:hypothetical protein [Cyanobacteria bacterium SZAS LIN-2]